MAFGREVKTSSNTRWDAIGNIKSPISEIHNKQSHVFGPGDPSIIPPMPREIHDLTSSAAAKPYALASSPLQYSALLYEPVKNIFATLRQPPHLQGFAWRNPRRRVTTGVQADPSHASAGLPKSILKPYPFWTAAKL